MFCARVKITLDVLALQIFLFSEEGWIGLSGYGIPNSALLILRFVPVDILQVSTVIVSLISNRYHNNLKNP